MSQSAVFEAVLTTPKAAVALTSLDGEPIERSRRLLLTAVGRAVPSEDGREPFFSEPIRGEVRLQSVRASLKAVPVTGSGKELAPVPLAKTRGTFTVPLPVGEGTHW